MPPRKKARRGKGRPKQAKKTAKRVTKRKRLAKKVRKAGKARKSRRVAVGQTAPVAASVTIVEEEVQVTDILPTDEEEGGNWPEVDKEEGNSGPDLSR